MSWEHLNQKSGGVCPVVAANNEQIMAGYSLCRVTTGKTATFWGYRLIIDLDAHGRFVGEDRYNLIRAVKDCAKKMQAQGLRLRVAGVMAEFSESGLSHNSGYGYLEGIHDPIHMMSAVFDKT